MNVALIGAGGDFGRSLAPYLVEHGHQVNAFDRQLPPGNDRIRVGIHHRVLDARDYGQVAACLAGNDAVVLLAAHRNPNLAPEPVVYADNTLISYHTLHACAILGIRRVVLASSINAIGGAYSQQPRYDYFPVDERHPCYAEDPYSLSKWVLEQQAESIARRHREMSIASLRLHWLAASGAYARQFEPSSMPNGDMLVVKHLWAYTAMADANQAVLAALSANFTGHEVFYIVADQNVLGIPSAELAERYWPGVPWRVAPEGASSFFDCAKAAHVLGWRPRE
jgi:UDP-glucose 4-epimerase